MDGLIEALDVGFDATRVGVVVYGNRPYLEVSLIEFGNESELRAKVAEIPYDPNKGTNTAGGITLMMEEFEDHPRTDVTRIAVIITDGKSTINDENTIPNAEEARDEGITVFAIGVTESAEESELRGMSSEPQELDRNYFISPTFDALADIQGTVTSQICPTEPAIITVAPSGESPQ